MAASTTARQAAEATTQHEDDMDIRQLRRSAANGYAASTSSAASRSSRRTSTPDTPPRFVIDLSLPPEQRYIEVCAAFEDQIRGLTPLFDEVMGEMVQFIPVKWLHRISKLLLRRVYDEEENNELKGISKATGVGMYLLVCFNVLLDLFMGCSSGGALVRDERGGNKMLHFRTLDWDMPSLRKIVVQLNFKTSQDGPIIASSITYAGYVGVLTGVRKDFSLSLNFRPNRHDKGKYLSDVKYYWHLLMVLLGKRRSISSQLRCFLLPQKTALTEKQADKSREWEYWTYSDAVDCVAGKTGKPLTTTACYLCFSSGSETTVMEKDRVTATARSSDKFVVVTNNDQDHEDETHFEKHSDSKFAEALAMIVEEGKDRRQCAEHNYHSMQRRNAKARQKAKIQGTMQDGMGVDDVVELVQKYPTTNETTHYACVMDPEQGVVSWCGRWVKPVGAKWIREHEGDYRSTFEY